MRDIVLNIRIGEHQWEQEKSQRLKLDITLLFDLKSYNEQHGGYVDYDPLREYLKQLENRPHVARIETLANDIVVACFELTQATRITLSVHKLDIFPEMGGVGLEYDVTREDFSA